MSCLHVSLRMSDCAFHWNSLRRGLSQSVSFYQRGSPDHFTPFAPFYLKIMAYYVNIIIICS